MHLVLGSVTHMLRRGLRMNEYYQPPLKGTRRESLKETRVDLPHFYGKENVGTYLDWEMKVE